MINFAQLRRILGEITGGQDETHRRVGPGADPAAGDGRPEDDPVGGLPQLGRGGRGGGGRRPPAPGPTRGGPPPSPPPPSGISLPATPGTVRSIRASTTADPG